MPSATMEMRAGPLFQQPTGRLSLAKALLRRGLVATPVEAVALAVKIMEEMAQDHVCVVPAAMADFWDHPLPDPITMGLGMRAEDA